MNMNLNSELLYFNKFYKSSLAESSTVLNVMIKDAVTPYKVLWEEKVNLSQKLSIQ